MTAAKQRTASRPAARSSSPCVLRLRPHVAQGAIANQRAQRKLQRLEGLAAFVLLVRLLETLSTAQERTPRTHGHGQAFWVSARERNRRCDSYEKGRRHKARSPQKCIPCRVRRDAATTCQPAASYAPLGSRALARCRHESRYHGTNKQERSETWAQGTHLSCSRGRCLTLSRHAPVIAPIGPKTNFSVSSRSCTQGKGITRDDESHTAGKPKQSQGDLPASAVAAPPTAAHRSGPRSTKDPDDAKWRAAGATRPADCRLHCCP